MESDVGTVYLLYGDGLPIQPLFGLSREAIEEITLNLEEKDLIQADYDELSKAFDEQTEVVERASKDLMDQARLLGIWRGVAIGTSISTLILLGIGVLFVSIQ